MPGGRRRLTLRLMRAREEHKPVKVFALKVTIWNSREQKQSSAASDKLLRRFKKKVRPAEVLQALAYMLF